MVTELLPQSEAAVGEDFTTADDEMTTDTLSKLLLDSKSQLNLGEREREGGGYSDGERGRRGEEGTVMEREGGEEGTVTEREGGEEGTVMKVEHSNPGINESVLISEVS